jgi:hypothetical protein
MRDGQAMEHADRTPFGDRVVSASRIGHRALSDERHDRVDARVDLLDPREVRGHDVARRDVFLAQPRCEINCARVEKF